MDQTLSRRLRAFAIVSLLSSITIIGAAPLAASAVDTDNGESLGAVTVSPSTGGWDDTTVSVDSDFTCPAVEGTLESYIYATIAAAGAESPALADSPSIYGGTTYAFTNPDSLWSAFDGDYASMDANEAAFPADNLDAGGGYWFAQENGDIASLRSALTVGGDYSLVLACAYVVDGASDTDPHFVPDATGHVAAAWTSLRVTATGWETGDGTSTPSAATTLALTTADTTSTTVTLSATVSSAGAIAATASGEIQFLQAGTAIGTSTVTSGVGTLTASGLLPNTDYSFTAIFTPADLTAFAGSTADAVSITTVAAGNDPVDTVLATGGVVTPGKNYRVEAPAGTFTAGDTLAGVIRSDPILLATTATAGSDGAASYSFVAPTSLPGGQHTLTLTGTPSTKTFILSFSVPDQVVVAAPVPTTPTTPAAANAPFAALTDWVVTSVATPTGTGVIFGGILVLAIAALIGWSLLFTRRATARAIEGDDTTGSGTV